MVVNSEVSEGQALPAPPSSEGYTTHWSMPPTSTVSLSTGFGATKAYACINIRLKDVMQAACNKPLRLRSRNAMPSLSRYSAIQYCSQCCCPVLPKCIPIKDHQMLYIAGSQCASEKQCYATAGVIKNARLVSGCMHRFCAECIEKWLRVCRHVHRLNNILFPAQRLSILQDCS